MIKSFKKLAIAPIVVSLLLVGGCSKKETQENPNTPDKVQTQGQSESNVKLPNYKFSNINDAKSQDEIFALLEKVGVDKYNVDMFKSSVKNYYKSVEGVNLINPDEKTSDLQVPYNLYELSDKWLENNTDFEDQNCRLTSFRLFNNFIESESNESYKNMDTDTLAVDLNTIEYNPDAKYDEKDTNKFANLYSSINVTDSKNIEQSAKEISKTLKDRKLSFKPSDEISLINGFIPGLEDNSLFVGHTGVLIKTNEGFVFIEKYGFAEPYQATLFKDKSEVKEYMFDRLKTSMTGDEQSYDPIIMENDKLM